MKDFFVSFFLEVPNSNIPRAIKKTLKYYSDKWVFQRQFTDSSDNDVLR